MHPKDFSLLASETISLVSPEVTFKATADKKYDNLLKYRNVTSYSQRLILHACPRKYQLAMHRANQEGESELAGTNLDFAFGHAVGAGVQNWLLTKSLAKAGLNASLAWSAGFHDRKDRAKKSLWESIIAVGKFVEFFEQELEEWELMHLPNGKPAIELSFSLRTNSGYRDYGHIDIVLRHRYTGRLAVLELKTTEREPEEAQYANSSQALGYSVMLGAVYPEIAEYDVIYCVYSSALREWNLLPFGKTLLSRAEWIKDLLLDHSALDTYHEIGFYPKRGESCFDYRRRCEFFGECNIVPRDELPWLEEEKEAEEVDWVVNLDEVIKQLKESKDES